MKWTFELGQCVRHSFDNVSNEPWKGHVIGREWYQPIGGKPTEHVYVRFLNPTGEVKNESIRMHVEELESVRT